TSELITTRGLDGGLQCKSTLLF
ncbi:MAG: hypothetical protein QOG93_361, partial [Gaiellaceae bacterium]|nr:hypothetical protein [Gaiellaceae bacterium]